MAAKKHPLTDLADSLKRASQHAVAAAEAARQASKQTGRARAASTKIAADETDALERLAADAFESEVGCILDAVVESGMPKADRSARAKVARDGRSAATAFALHSVPRPPVLAKCKPSQMSAAMHARRAASFEQEIVALVRIALARWWAHGIVKASPQKTPKKIPWLQELGELYLQREQNGEPLSAKDAVVILDASQKRAGRPSLNTRTVGNALSALKTGRTIHRSLRPSE